MIRKICFALLLASSSLMAAPALAMVVNLQTGSWDDNDLVALPALSGAYLELVDGWHGGPAMLATHNARISVFHSFDDKVDIAMQARFASALAAFPYKTQRAIVNKHWLPPYVVVGYGDESWWPCHAENIAPDEMLHEGPGSTCLNVTDDTAPIVGGTLRESPAIFITLHDLKSLHTFDGRPYFRQLAHAYHHHVIHNGLQNQCIRRAYIKAMDKGLYEQVDQSHHRSGVQPHRRVRRDRADASWNHVEWFAETAVSYFMINDEYPFDRHDLYEYDPDGYTIQRHFWDHPNTGVGRCPVDW